MEIKGKEKENNNTHNNTINQKNEDESLDRDILRLKITYLGELMMAMDKFDNTENAKDMK